MRKMWRAMGRKRTGPLKRNKDKSESHDCKQKEKPCQKGEMLEKHIKRRGEKKEKKRKRKGEEKERKGEKPQALAICRTRLSNRSTPRFTLYVA